MAVAVILVLASLVLSTGAAGCSEDQQCSDCHETTGYCETKCFTGYFALKCKTHCSNSCVSNACESTQTGIGRCTEGCVPGYHGTDCSKPCKSQGTTCTKCQSGCDQGYCQLGSSCVSGCVDGYYGSDCKNCSSRCKTCNRITGTCEVCEAPYLGPKCQTPEMCATWCFEGCGREVIGNFCVEECDDNCRPAPNINDTTRCLGPGANTSVYCSSECHNQGGECLHGCVEGWYGPRCSSPCSAGCSGGRCDAAGACVDGCRPGYFGRDFCNETCEVCRDGVCDQTTGTCINGCDVSGRRCEPSCTSNCSREYCSGETCKTDDWGFDGISVGIPTGCVLLVLAILVSNYVCYRKGRSANRVNLTDKDPITAVEYQSWHMYDDIEEWDTEESTENQDNLEGLGLTMPVMADVFQPEPARHQRDTSSESPASSTSQSYTHLIPDVVDDDQRKAESYISPVQDPDQGIREDEEEPNPSVEYQSCHNYYDIEEGDLDAEEPPENQENKGEELALAMPVIADVFQPEPAIVYRDDDTSSESPASSTSQSYTHLIPGVVTDDQRKAESYISPVEDPVV
ncbi:multiple epidermal growth factor-like domains protein 11 [Haliotis cracherodii]|uniref:multiple epidermal growth factor-like domains protein 11 n=1 Tax=Haliotis cracherodii TaxID=6455 RepID=UPI0039E8F22F